MIGEPRIRDSLLVYLSHHSSIFGLDIFLFLHALVFFLILSFEGINLFFLTFVLKFNSTFIHFIYFNVATFADKKNDRGPIA